MMRRIRPLLLLFQMVLFACFILSRKFRPQVLLHSKKIISSLPLIIATITSNPDPSFANMLTFPLPAPLKNNIVLVRSGESFADARHEVQTNPVKKLLQDNALTLKGKEQAAKICQELTSQGFSPTYVWTSNTERAYETASIIARECQLGQNRVVPEFSFLDARAVGKFEGDNDEKVWTEIHQQDETQGIKYKPPASSDGTPSDSVSDVLVRANQLVSTIDSMYSGENVIIVSPDSEVLSVLMAALQDDTPDKTIPFHAQYAFKNGEYKRLVPHVKPPEKLPSGNTQEEEDLASLRSRAMRVTGRSGSSNSVRNNLDQVESSMSWMEIWKQAIDFQTE